MSAVWLARDEGDYGWHIYEGTEGWPANPPIAGNLSEDVAKTIVREHNLLIRLLDLIREVAPKDLVLTEAYLVGAMEGREKGV